MHDIKINPNQMVLFSDYVQDFCGMDFSGENSLGLKISVEERMQACNLKDTEDYLEYLKSESSEREDLISLLSVPETYFFRDKKQFDVLKNQVLPEVVTRKSELKVGRPTVKIVSCGCSAGAEPYSIAIAVKQTGLMSKVDFQIQAFDINKVAIEYAKKAQYTKYFFREAHTEFLANFFEAKNSHFLLSDEIKEMVQFQVANLFDLEVNSVLMKDADIIFFRNVQIYFKDKGRRQVLDTFAENMSPQGYLFIGYSESLMGRDSRFVPEEFSSAHVWRLKGELPKEKPAPEVCPEIPRSKVAQFTSFESSVAPETQTTPSRPEESYYEEACGYVMIKKMKKAEEAFQAQLCHTPRHVKSLAGLAQIYADAGRDELALETCERVVSIDNLFTGVYFIRGLIHYKRSELEDALSQFKKAVYCDEQHFLAHYYLGLAYDALEKSEQARTQYEATIEVIHGMGGEGLRREIAGYSASYILSLCADSIK